MYLHYLCAPHSAHVFNPLAVSANDLPYLTDWENQDSVTRDNFSPVRKGLEEAHMVLVATEVSQGAHIQASCHSALRIWSPSMDEGLVLGTTPREKSRSYFKTRNKIWFKLQMDKYQKSDLRQNQQWIENQILQLPWDASWCSGQPGRRRGENPVQISGRVRPKSNKFCNRVYNPCGLWCRSMLLWNPFQSKSKKNTYSALRSFLC